MLLLYVVELGVAKGIYIGGVEERLGKTAVALVECLLGFGCVPVAPCAVTYAQADSAVLADKERLAVFVALMVVLFKRLGLFSRFGEPLVFFTHRHRVRVVVVDVIKIGGSGVAVSADVNAWAGGIVSLCHGIDIFQSVIVNSLVLVAPGFVQRAPADDGGVVNVALKHLRPFSSESVHGVVRAHVHAPVAVFAPDHIAFFVAVVQEKGFKDLFVKTGAVKSRRHRQINVESELIRVLCGVDSLGIEALVENETLEYVLSVEIEARFVKPDVSHSEITLDFILSKGQHKIVKTAVSKLPQMKLGQRHNKAECSFGVSLCLANEFPLIKCFRLDISSTA